MDRGLLGELKIFLCVVDEGSFSAAAAKLELPLATVSRKVRDLEQRLDVQLLHRTTRRLTVTDAGRGLYEHCIDSVEAIEESVEAVRAQSREVHGELRILAPYGLGQMVVEPLLHDFRKQYPDINLCLQLDNKPLDLVQYRFDVAIRKGPVPDSSYHVRHWRHLRTHIVASPDYLREHPVSGISALKDHSLLAVADDLNPVEWRLTGPDGPAVVKARPVFAANDPAIVFQQAMRAQGIALLSAALCRQAVESGALEILFDGYHGEADTEYVVLFPRRATSEQKVRAFVDHLMTALGDRRDDTSGTAG